MQNQKIFAVLTIVLTIAITVALVSEFSSSPLDLAGSSDDAEAQGTAGTLSTITDAADGMIRAANNAALLTGINQVPPDRKAMPKLEAIPWSRNAALRLFQAADRIRTCQLFPPGMQSLESLASPRPGVAGPIGRLPVFSLALRMDPTGRATLPKLSKEMIESYLDDHVITIQATLYHDEAGSLYFGDQLKAAFIARLSPSLTIKPEQMVADYVDEFRALGLFSPPGFDADINELRTLVLLFRYDLQQEELATATSSRVREFELIFLHLLQSDASLPAKVAVFATSDGRTKFHELTIVRPRLLPKSPSIAATIRFDDFRLMGMYPANPVVTGVHHQSRLTLPAESVRSRMLGLGDKEQTNFSDLLDELHAEADAAESNPPESTAAAL